MIPSKVNDQPAYLLHRINYAESSLILDCFSHDYGRISLISKGGKKRKNQAVFQFFQPLTINFSGKSELKILTRIDSKSRLLDAKSNVAGMYINELLINLLPKHEPFEDIFSAYSLLLNEINDQNLEVYLRKFEFMLLSCLGVLPDFSCDAITNEAINDDSYYLFHPEQGFTLTQKKNACLGRHVNALNQQSYDNMSLQLAKYLMRSIIDWQLNGKPVRTRELFKQLFKSK